jgi:hypothetical protein|tara:strand:- start:3543 stop:3710 length:168 start_codon:yes stop_codon:yes gene_type:complete
MPIVKWPYTQKGIEDAKKAARMHGGTYVPSGKRAAPPSRKAPRRGGAKNKKKGRS